MDTKIGSLGFTIPIIEDSKQATLEWEPKSVHSWCVALPMSKVGESAKKLYHVLNEFSCLDIDPNKRFDICEIFRMPVQWICFNLRKYYLNQKINLNENSLIIANLAQNFQILLALNYKQVVAGLNDLNLPGIEKGIMPTSIYRIMYYYSLMLLRSYQLYEESPKNIWHELNIFYRYAERINALRENILDQDSMDDRMYTIEAAYKKAILLSICNPYQWQQNEQEFINNTIYKWEPYTNLRVVAISDNKKPGAYIVDLATDNPPVSSLNYNTTLTESCMVLDLHNLIEHLLAMRDEIKKNEVTILLSKKEDQEYSVALPTLEHLLKEWTAKHPITYKKYPFEGTFHVVFGLSTIIESILNNNYTGTLCTLKNDYNLGSRLIWSDPTYPSLLSGELLAFNYQNCWYIGVVKWVKHSITRELSLGIEYIGTHLIPVAARVFKDEQIVSYKLQALLVSEQNAQQTSSIITPTVPFKEGKKIDIKNTLTTKNSNNKNIDTTVNLSKQIDATSKYRQFACQVDNILLESANTDKLSNKNALEQKSVSVNAKLSANRFAEIWKILD